MRIRPTASGICLLCISCWLLAESFWDRKPYEEWTEKEALKILSDSPWGDEKVIGDTFVTGGPGGPGMSGGGGRGRSGTGGSGGATGEDLAQSRSVSVRLHSASPIRMALSRRAQLSGTFDDQQAGDFIRTEPAPGYIVVGLSVRGGRTRITFGDEEIETLRQKVYLELKKSKKRIPFERLVPPGRNRAAEAYLYFPRTEEGRELFVPEEKGFKFVANLDSRTKIQIDFEFARMIFGGRLEI